MPIGTGTYMKKTIWAFTLLAGTYLAQPALANIELCQNQDESLSEISSQEIREFLLEHFRTYDSYQLSYKTELEKSKSVQAIGELVGENSVVHRWLKENSGYARINSGLSCATVKAHLKDSVQRYARASRIFQIEFPDGLDYRMDVSKPYMLKSLDFCKYGQAPKIYRILEDIGLESVDGVTGSPPKELTAEPFLVLDVEVAYQILKVETVRILKPSRPWFRLPVSNDVCNDIQKAVIGAKIYKLQKIDELLEVSDKRLKSVLDFNAELSMGPSQ